MNFIECYKKHQLMKRACWGDPLYDFYHTNYSMDEGKTHFFSESSKIRVLRPEDLLADDWVTKDDVVEQNRITQIEEDAYEKALNLIFSTVKKELGKI